ncbi:hypothetical protein [[Clostridium] innocuum]|uniref:hypothetical protein n=1 Tax=Clostridium innocuum TaxID=1522 RepID=UPI000C2FCA3C|nr:hypothetical protein [[Clostridium] innocuum]MCR0176100.1 hypothetical protein [[Clostridium] innocuum]MCR0642916.1 hypothetical protein [[Clostridium] innocuum]
MGEHKNELILLNEYGLSVQPTENDDYTNYKKVDKDDFAKLNACFRDVPQILKSLNDVRYYSGTYRVIYDKGLGVLQKSAKDPNLFRANIVTAGTNNDITGQALLQELKPDELMKVSNLLMSAFIVASIATNQYYLARIDSKLETIEKKIDEIKRFLEIDKESQLWADGEFLKEVRNNIEFIINDDVYRQVNLTNIQSVRRTALTNIKLYYEQLLSIKSYLDVKDNDKKTASNIEKYKGYLPKFWYSVYLFVMSYYLEVYLSKITDENFFENIICEMNSIIGMFEEGYSLIDGEISKYIDEVKALKANEVPAKMMKSIGRILEVTRIPAFNPFIAYGAKGVGVVLDFGADYLDKMEKTSKKAKKQDLIEGLEAVIKPYSDLEPLSFHVEAVNTMKSIYNNRVEIIMTENNAYINYDANSNFQDNE